MTAPIPGGIGPQPDGTFRADDPKKPHLTTIRVLNAMFGHEKRPRLIYYRESFYVWRTTHWEELDTVSLKAQVYQLLEHAVYVGQVGRGQQAVPAWVDYDVNRAKLAEIIEGLQHQTLVDRMVETPTWLEGNKPVMHAGLDARDMISCGNWIINATNRGKFYHTPSLFNTFSVDYEFDEYAPRPNAWLEFLHELWPDDPDSISTLQEIFGYLLTRRTDLQKMFMLIGPPRSGKGTIVRVLSALLGGSQNVTSISMADLNQSFGLEDVMDKTLAVMQDARFRSRDEGMAVERILSITGEDPVSVNRKNKQLITVKLPVRFMLVSNEIPKLQDESGALKTRMLLLRMRKSVDEARRDPNLINRLLVELPGILNWSLDGLERLTRRRAFVQPKSAAEDLDLLSHLSSPTTAFLEDCCRLGENLWVPKKDLFKLWQVWCSSTGVYPGNDIHFSRNLYAAASNVVAKKRTVGDGKRAQGYEGIEISTEGYELLSGSGIVDWPNMGQA